MINNEKFNPQEYADILWMEDIDTQDTPARKFGGKTQNPENSSQNFTEAFVKKYIPEKYWFRLHPYKYVKETLKELEQNLPLYSCVILDINMEKGFYENFEGEEFDDIKNILGQNNVIIEDRQDFKINAGFYIYLYLLHRGMPADRIAILTGNETEAKRKVFRTAGIKMPVIIEKQATKKEEHLGAIENSSENHTPLSDWLEITLDARYRLRSCMVIMGRYLLDALFNESKKEYAGEAFRKRIKEKGEYTVDEDFFENAKMMLQSLKNIPLRLPKGEALACDFFKQWIWQIAQPWEATEKPSEKDKRSYAYWTTMRTTRNWLAHNVIKYDDNGDKKFGFKYLSTEALLFGLGMRGMFDLYGLLNEKMTQYEAWENELLSIIHGVPLLPEHNCESLEAEIRVDELCKLVMRSCHEFHLRSGSLRNGEITQDIGLLIYEIGQKENKFLCYERDLARAFLHGVAKLFVIYPRDSQKTSLGFSMVINSKHQGQYYNYWCNQTRYYLKKYDGTPVQDEEGNDKFIDVDANTVNINREWDYVESLLGLVDEELSRLEEMRSRHKMQS